MNFIEIQFWKIAKWIIHKGYGTKNTSCDGSIDECASCQALRVVRWIDGHIELIKVK